MREVETLRHQCLVRPLHRPTFSQLPCMFLVHDVKGKVESRYGEASRGNRKGHGGDVDDDDDDGDDEFRSLTCRS